MSNDEIRYGVIGTGMMGCEHIANINALPGAKVVAVADPFEQSLEAGQAIAGLSDAACHTNISELLDMTQLDAVVIATPDNAHTEPVIEALEAGVHVLIEKPLATSIADCDRMIDAARGHDKVVWMGLEYRYKPSIARLIEETEAGSAGTVQMVAIREHRFPFLPKVGAWNRFRANTGGTLVEKCCHFFDLMNLITGATPVRVFASGSQAVNHLDEQYDGRRPDIIDNAYVIVDYDSGVRAMLDLCMFAEATTNEQELAVVGDGGKIEAFVPDAHVRVGDRSTGEVSVSVARDERITYEGLHEGSSYLEHLDFLEAIRTGAPAKITLEEGKTSVAMGLAGHLSIDEARPVEMTEILG